MLSKRWQYMLGFYIIFLLLMFRLALVPTVVLPVTGGPAGAPSALHIGQAPAPLTSDFPIPSLVRSLFEREEGTMPSTGLLGMVRRITSIKLSLDGLTDNPVVAAGQNTRPDVSMRSILGQIDAAWRGSAFSGASSSGAPGPVTLSDFGSYIRNLFRWAGVSDR